MALIYKITNDVNGKIYIGKTTRTLTDRWVEHLNDRLEKDTSIPLYNAMNKYGIEHFSIEIVEDNIPKEEINDKERYYISYFNSLSHEGGYNVTPGGDGGRTSSKLTETEVAKIVTLLLDQDNIESLSEIGRQFNISSSVIGTINRGQSWYNPTLSYPLRKYDATGLNLTRTQYAAIVNDLQQTSLSMQEIEKKYNICESKLTAINQGQHCYDGKHPYYKGIYEGDFPIRRTANLKRNIEADRLVDILYDIIFTKDSMATIATRYGEKGNTLTYIASGKRRKELTMDFITPLRKNIEENQKIFKTIYPNYERSDAQ